MNSTSKIFVDFNNADKTGRVRLNTNETLKDIERMNIKMRPGLEVVLDDHDSLITTGIVNFSEEENIWVVQIDWDKLK